MNLFKLFRDSHWLLFLRWGFQRRLKQTVVLLIYLKVLSPFVNIKQFMYTSETLNSDLPGTAQTGSESLVSKYSCQSVNGATKTPELPPTTCPWGWALPFSDSGDPFHPQPPSLHDTPGSFKSRPKITILSMFLNVTLCPQSGCADLRLDNKHHPGINFGPASNPQTSSPP